MEKMKGIIWKLHAQGKINHALLYFPAEVLLCANEYVKLLIGEVEAKDAEYFTEGELPFLGDCGETNEDGHSKKG